MTAKKPGARERLLAHCDAQTPKIMPRVWRAKTRRLLAAVLREAAEAAGVAAYDEVVAAYRNELSATDIAECALFGARNAVLRSGRPAPSRPRRGKP